MKKIKTAIYVDALNLYYGGLKGSEYKWLDLKKLFQNMLEDKHEIVTIKYFTTEVLEREHDPSVLIRQQSYIRALEKTIPEFNAYYGRFLENEKQMRRADNPKKSVMVIRTEEKQSDVNLCVHLVNDAWRDGYYDCAVIVSNDTDMVGGMKMMKECHSKKKRGLITPPKYTVSKSLKDYADFSIKISRQQLKNAQLPERIPDSNIYKPPQWK